MRDIIPPVCPYCHIESQLCDSIEVQPDAPRHRKYWVCRPCGAYIGTHDNSPTFKPVGRLANAELRAAKKMARRAFDPLWLAGYEIYKQRHGQKASKSYARHVALNWLAEVMPYDNLNCHIDMMDVKDCHRVIEVCKERGNQLLMRY